MASIRTSHCRCLICQSPDALRSGCSSAKRATARSRRSRRWAGIAPATRSRGWTEKAATTRSPSPSCMAAPSRSISSWIRAPWPWTALATSKASPHQDADICFCHFSWGWNSFLYTLMFIFISSLFLWRNQRFVVLVEVPNAWKVWGVSLMLCCFSGY
jgi:hypothetical protein